MGAKEKCRWEHRSQGRWVGVGPESPAYFLSRKACSLGQDLSPAHRLAGYKLGAVDAARWEWDWSCWLHGSWVMPVTVGFPLLPWWSVWNRRDSHNPSENITPLAWEPHPHTPEQLQQTLPKESLSSHHLKLPLPDGLSLPALVSKDKRYNLLGDSMAPPIAWET